MHALTRKHCACRICTAQVLLTQPVLDVGNSSLASTSESFKDGRMRRGKAVLPTYAWQSINAKDIPDEEQ